MKENDHLVVTKMTTFYFQISLTPTSNILLLTNQVGPGWHGSKWNIGVLLVCHGLRLHGDRQSLCRSFMEGSSVEVNFGPLLGKLGEVVVELLTHGLS